MTSPTAKMPCSASTASSNRSAGSAGIPAGKIPGSAGIPAGKIPGSAGIPAGEIHLWTAALNPPATVLRQLAATLSPTEQARAARFKFPRHQRRFRASQGSLRRILGQYLHQPPAALQFQHTERGKPFLADAAAHGLRFNLSHSHEVAVCAVIRDHEIGVDVERLRPMPDAEQIAARFFSAQEQAALAALPPAERDVAFFRCWTRKEAFIKAIGEGLHYPLDAFSVTLAPDEPARLVSVADDPQEAARWTMREFLPAPGYIAAVAVRTDYQFTITNYQFTITN